MDGKKEFGNSRLSARLDDDDEDDDEVDNIYIYIYTLREGEK